MALIYRQPLVSGGRGSIGRGRQEGAAPPRHDCKTGLRSEAAHRGSAVVAQNLVLLRLVVVRRRQRWRLLVALVRYECGGVGGKRLLLILPRRQPRRQPWRRLRRLLLLRLQWVLAVLTTFAMPTRCLLWLLRR